MSSYAGGKHKLAPKIVEVIRQYKEPEQTYVEPFAGGLNVIKHILGCRRIAGELNPYVVALYKAIVAGWVPPNSVTKEDHKHVRDNKQDYPPELVGYVGTELSYSGKWFAGLKELHKSRKIYNGWVSDRPFIKSIEFHNCDYRELPIPPNSFIYCDPPYEGLTTYLYEQGEFHHWAFWQWCRAKIEEGHTLLISEYNAPRDFICVRSFEVNQTLRTDKGMPVPTRIEKLFIHRDQI